MPLAGELHESLDHDRLRRHVDAERQRLGREDDLAQSPLEQLLDRFLEQRDEPGVVRGDAAFQRVEPVVEPEDVEVLLLEHRRAQLDVLADPLALVRRRQPDARLAADPDGLLASGPREDEHDGRRQLLLVEPLHHLDTVRPIDAPVTVGRAGATVTRSAAAARLTHVQASQGGVGHVSIAIADEHLMQLRADHVVVLDGDRTFLLYHDVGRPPHRAEPVSEFLGVRQGCR